MNSHRYATTNPSIHVQSYNNGYRYRDGDSSSRIYALQLN
jgi:hypothetical protein